MGFRMIQSAVAALCPSPTPRLLSYSKRPILGTVPRSTDLLDSKVDVEKHYAALLRTAARVRSVFDGKAVHCRILRTVPRPRLYLLNSLANMYCKCCSLPHALSLFDATSHPDVVSWNTIVDGFFLAGLTSDALARFREMFRCGVAPDEFSFFGVLKSCDLRTGCAVHCVVVKFGLGDSAFVANGLAEFYAEFNLLSDTMTVFEGVERKDIALVNSVIGLLAKAGNLQQAFTMFCHCALAARLQIDRATFVNLLSGVDGFELHRLGLQVHGLIIKIGFEDGAVENSLVRMYSNCGFTYDAHDLLLYSKSQNVVSWTSLIKGCADQEQFSGALDVFCQIYHNGMLLDDVLLACILNVAAASEWLTLGIQLHAVVIKHGFELNYCISHTLMDMYAKCMSMPEVLKIFRRIGEDFNVSSWTILVSGYAKCGSSMEALKTFYQMNSLGINSDSVACISVLIGCSDLQAIDQGEQVHAYLIKSGFDTDLSVQTVLISLYSECGRLNEAVKLFEMMATHDVVSWTAIISAYKKLGCNEKVFMCLKQMLHAGIKPNHFTLVSALTTSAKLTSALAGKSIHSAVIKTGMEEDKYIGSALIDMYCKCGSIGCALRYFSRASKHDIILWNALLSGYAQHGNVVEMLKAYEKMLGHGIEPDSITFLSVLSGCSRGGLLDKVFQYFASMKDEYGIIPQMEHHACVVDALARADLLKDAINFIDEMGVTPGSTVLRTLISFCIVHGHVKLGLASVAKMILLGQMDSSAFVLLSNLYAIEKKWHARTKVRDAMEVDIKNAKKVAVSWIS